MKCRVRIEQKAGGKSADGQGGRNRSLDESNPVNGYQLISKSLPVVAEV